MPYGFETDDHILRSIAAACGLAEDFNAYLTASEIRSILGHYPGNVVHKLGMTPLAITKFLRYYRERQRISDPYSIGQDRTSSGSYRWRVEFRRSPHQTAPVSTPAEPAHEHEHETMPTRFEREDVI